MLIPVPLIAPFTRPSPVTVVQPPVKAPEPVSEPVKQAEQANVVPVVEMSLEPHTQSKSTELLQSLQTEEPEHESSLPPAPPFFKNTVHRAHQGRRHRR